MFTYGASYLPLHLEHERRSSNEHVRFWPWMALFMAAMVGLAVAQDLVLLFTALHAACDAEVVRRIAADGFDDLRPAHGYVFQHLVPGPIAISELARRLGMTPQGASKLAIELERFGYVARQTDPSDRRSHAVTLTERGWAAIESGRAARAAVTAELRVTLGEPAADRLVSSLQHLAEHTGGLRTLLARRLRPGL